MRRLLPLLLIACAAPDEGNVSIIGHGGAGSESEYPMNSRAAMFAGLELGADGIELDVQLSKDGVLVAYHAEELSELTTCSGKINAHDWGVLGSCAERSGTKHFPMVRLDNALVEVVSRFPDAHFTLDCKLFAEGEWWPYLEAFSDAVVGLCSLPELHGRVVVECQVVDFLELVARKSPVVPLFLYATSADAGIDTAAAHRCIVGITIDNDLINADQVARAHSHGMLVTLFGVSSNLGHRDALSKNPDRLQTDAPELFAR